MGNVIAVLLLLTLPCVWAQTPPDDSWVVVALDQAKTEDVAPADMIKTARDPDFQLLDTKSHGYRIQRGLLGLDRDTSRIKLSAVKELLRKPTQIQVTLSHYGNVYRCWCRISTIHLSDPDIPKELSTKEREPCGVLMSSYVGKRLPTWPPPPKANIDGWRVGIDTTTTLPGFVSIVARRDGDKGYTEGYLIWSVEPAKGGTDE